MNNILEEINEMIEDAETDDDINQESAEWAQQFLIILNPIVPAVQGDLDLHPNGNVIMTCRDKKWVVSLVFSEKGQVHWAALNKKSFQSKKGNFNFFDLGKAKIILLP